MKYKMLLPLLAGSALLAGCQSTPKTPSEMLVGTWTCQGNIPTPQVNMAYDVVGSYNSDGTANSEGKFVLTGGNNFNMEYAYQSEGEWSIEGDKLTETTTAVTAENLTDPAFDAVFSLAEVIMANPTATVDILELTETVFSSKAVVEGTEITAHCTR